MSARGIVWALLAALCAAPAAAQRETTPADTTAVAASAVLPAGHWAVGAARRAEALGLLPGYIPPEGAVPRAVVAAALRRAARNASSSPGLAALAEGWYRRFAEEFGDTGADGVRGSGATLGYEWLRGRAAPGTGELAPGHTGAQPLPDHSGVAAGLGVHAALGRHLALELAPAVEAGDFQWARYEVAAALGPVALSFGRQPVGYGSGAGGGITLSGSVPFDRLQVETMRPLVLPGLLGYLGPVSLHTFGSRITGARHARRPYLWGATGVVQPHPRFTVAVHRVAMFGGEGEEVTAGRLLSMLVGRVKDVGFENQEVSVEGRLRLPTERVLPATVYLEWGAEDAAGALRDVPGIVAGVYLPALPALPQVALGAERASFPRHCCGNPAWYRHAAFPGAWAIGDAPLGHPLGGHGTQLLLYSQADLLQSRLRVEARAFRRERRTENLFVPGREGRSTGGSADLAWRIRPRAELSLSAARDAGEGWRERTVSVSSRIFF